MAESGLPGYESNTWYGLVGPAALSKDVVSKVNLAVASVLKTPDTRERYVALGAEPVTNTPEQFAAYLKKDMQDWAKVVTLSGAKLD
jgi:tripartite-type tricarboxylate transporter receptor subunit TctC